MVGDPPPEEADGHEDHARDDQCGGEDERDNDEVWTGIAPGNMDGEIEATEEVSRPREKIRTRPPRECKIRRDSSEHYC